MTDHFPAATAMREHGGGFASHLAEAWFFADPDNRARIEAAFPELFEKYAKVAEKLESRVK